MKYAAELENLAHFAGMYVVSDLGAGIVRALTPTHVIVESKTGRFFGSPTFVPVI